MKYCVCAIRDVKAGVYSQPFFSAAPGVAVRSFGDEVNRSDEKNMYFRHPGDFELWNLGTFDDGTGLFDSGAGPVQLATAASLVTS